MGVVERREREKEQRRQDIIDAAEQVFFSRGIANATMDDVADVAELSKGTLYLYFKNKEDLYLAIIMRGMTLLQQKFEAALASVDKGIDKVGAIGVAYFDFCKNHHEYFNAMLYFESYSGSHDDECHYANQCMEQSNATFAICARAVQAGIDDGTIRQDVDPLKIALTLYGLATGLLQVIAMKGTMIQESYKIDPYELIESFFDLVDKSLRA